MDESAALPPEGIRDLSDAPAAAAANPLPEPAPVVAEGQGIPFEVIGLKATAREGLANLLIQIPAARTMIGVILEEHGIDPATAPVILEITSATLRIRQGAPA